MFLARFSLEPRRMAHAAKLLKERQGPMLTDYLQKQQTSKDYEGCSKCGKVTCPVTRPGLEAYSNPGCRSYRGDECCQGIGTSNFITFAQLYFMSFSFLSFLITLAFHLPFFF